MESKNTRGGGKREIGTGKGAGSLEQGEQVAVGSRNRLLRALWTWHRLKTPGRSPHLDLKGWLRWTYDTGATISAFPVDAKIDTETQSNECSCKTASGELISDRGGLRVQGTTEYGYGVIIQARKADVHKTLISSKVHSKSHVAADSNEGYIIPCKQHTCEKDSTIRSKRDCQ